VEKASGEAQEVRAKDEAAAAYNIWQLAASIKGRWRFCTFFAASGGACFFLLVCHMSG
jgi:hypothetical protein